MKLLRSLLGLAAALAFCAPAIAQSIPKVPYLGQNDLVQVIPNGAPSAGNYYVPMGWLGGAPAYTNLGVITTGNSYTFANGVTWMIAQPAGTLAAVTLTTAPNPSDGQRECFESTQTTTALTWNANTGQTMNPTITAGVAGTPICIMYVRSLATWYRT